MRIKYIWQRKAYIGAALGIFFINYFLDRGTKLLAVTYLKNAEPLSFFNNFFILTYAENTGAFLSLGAAWNIYLKYFLLLIIPILICAVWLFYLMFKEKRFYRVILGSCVAGGGIGNLIDRLCNQFKVIDFMNFGVGNIRTGILNAADLSVTFGALLLIVLEAKYERKARS